MSWSAPIWIYLWLAGMAGGAYLAAFVASRFSAENKPLLRLATFLGIPLAIIGVLLLVVDLGQPLRFWHLFSQFKLNSPMSAGTWILLAWVGIAFVMAVTWWFENRVSKEAADRLEKIRGPLGWAAMVLAAFLVAYTGVLLAISSQSLWADTFLLPALFVASAVSTGVALLILVALVAGSFTKGGLIEMTLAMDQVLGTTKWNVSGKTITKLAEADAIIIVVELVALIGYAIWLATSSSIGAGDALRVLLTGSLAAPFWVGVVLLALLVPLGLDLANRGKSIQEKGVRRAVLASSLCVVLGGLVLRAVITIGGQL